MCSKAYQFSRKKLFSQAYHTRKSGKCIKRFSREVSYRKLKNVDNYKPMSIEYLKHLTKVLKRYIKILSEEKIICSYGKNLEKPSINVKYVKNCSKCMHGNVIKIGHFTLKNGKDASSEKIFPNECLLRVISAQCGIEPSKLRREIIRKVRKLKSSCHMKNLIYDSQMPVPIIVDIVGGARYNGTSKTDAKQILDQSQSGKSHPDMKTGHPRGHASYPQATGAEESVENYSKFSRKTGFFSRSDQDFIAHFVLEHNDSQDAMELLNESGKNGIKEVVRIRAKDLRVDENKLPQIQDWHKGKKIGDPGRINDVVVVMKHYYQKYDDEKANVFILTMYPTL